MEQTWSRRESAWSSVEGQTTFKITYKLKEFNGKKWRRSGADVERRGAAWSGVERHGGAQYPF